MLLVGGVYGSLAGIKDALMPDYAGMIMNRIYIRDLRVVCIIGTEPKERIEKQEICINIVLDCDFMDACKSDDLHDTVDYKSLKNEIVEFVAGSEFMLLEKLAAEVAAICRRPERVKRAKVCIDKPGALTGARSVAVEVEI